MRRQEKLNIVDMSQYSDEDLLKQGMLGIFLLVLKHIYDEDINVFAEQLFPNPAELNSAVEKLGGAVMTTAEMLIKEDSSVAAIIACTKLSLDEIEALRWNRKPHQR